ncbi:MAG: starch-binding protein [Agathobacter sp.]|nr:starch-binding protein [Agathobacter sp.]
MKGKTFTKKGLDFLKRVMSTVLVVAMLFTMVGIYIPAETFKAADKDVTIYFRDENGWANVNAYIWDANGANPNGAWPGSGMTKEGDDWVWRGTWNDAETLNIIFNSGSNQTADLSRTPAQLQESAEWRYYSSGSWEKVGGEDENPEYKDISLCFENVPNWEKVYAYVWDEDGKTLNGAWPGSEISKNGNYYVWSCNDWNTDEPVNIIFNNGSGSQTENLFITRDDLLINTDWIFTPTSDASGQWECKKIDKARYDIAAIAGDFDKFDGSEQSNWAANGGTNGEGLMEYLGRGYYYKKIIFNELTSTQNVEFKAVFGGDWNKDGDIGGTEGNYKLAVPAGSTYVEIIADINGWTLYNNVEHLEKVEAIFEELGIERVPEEDNVPDLTIYFKNTQNWSKVNVYAWAENGATVNGSWPGGAMTKDGDYYVWKCQEWNLAENLNLIFNNGSEQTVDLALTKDDFAKHTEWVFTLTEKNDGGKWDAKKTDVPPYEKAAIAGNFDSFTGSGQPAWNPAGGDDGAGLMDYIGDGYYYKKISFNALTDSKTAEFKAAFNGGWDVQIGGSDGNNYKLSVPAGSTSVKIIADTENKKLYNSVEHATDIENILVELGVIEPPAEMEVIDGNRGTTTFVAITDADKEVTLYYGKKSEVEANGTSALKSAKMTQKADEKGVYVSDELFLGDEALDYVFYYDVEGVRTLDGAQETVTIGGKDYSNYKRAAFTGRVVTVPGTLPGPSWDVTSNVMTYVGNGLYEYTFENVPAGKYEYKIALNKTWDPENYGAGGVGHGDNITVAVPSAQDVTIYYSDFSHYAVDSINYIFADVTLSGTGVPTGTKLTDDGLTGIYSVIIDMPAGTYDDYKLIYDGKTYEFTQIVLSEGKEVTFCFDPVTGIFYHNASNTPIEEENIYYTTKDKAYKSVFGSVEQNKNVTFTIETGTDVTSVSLVVKGMENKTLPMEKGAVANGVQKWTVTTSFGTIGEYDYYFMLSNGSTIAVYGDDSSYAGEGEVCDLTDCTPYELVVHVEGFETPDWMKNAVIYQIFPDRFYNGNIENDKAQESARGEVDYEFVDDWYLLPENPEQEEMLTEEQYKEHGAFYGDGNWSNEIYGGDLEGIFERIDYLKALGVNVIYLNPIFASISNHRYDACDYTEIDPILGTLGDFEELVEVAEANGMKIILDGVFNHVSDDSIYFDRYYKFIGKSEKIGAYPYWAYVYDYMAENSVDKAAAEKAAKAYFTEEYGITDYSYTEWFAVNNAYMKDSEGENVVDNIGLRAGKPVFTYEGWWGYDSMPVIYSTNGSEFQTGNWAEEIIYNEDGTSVTQYWISKGNNGWRLDVANEVSDETWQEFRKSVKALDSDAVIIGEIWDDATKYIMGDMYDSVMNYMFRNAVLSYAKGENATTVMEALEKIRERYPEEAFYAMMNLVGSHDTSRVLSFLDGVDDDRNQKDEAHAFPTYEKTSDAAKKRQYLVALMQFTYAGAPTIYYGDEIGMVGSDDPDDRRAMEWGKGNKELVTWYATLAAIRAQHDVLRTGSVEPIVVNDSVMGYVRRDADEVMIILVNNATSDKEVTIDLAEIKVDADTLTDLLTNKAATIANGKLTVTVPAVNGVILSETVKTYTVDQNALAPAYDPAYIGGADLTPDEEEKPVEPNPEEPKDENIPVEGSGIDKEDVTIAEDNKNNEVVKEDGKDKVVLGNDKMPDLIIKGETEVIDEEAFFIRQYLVEGELFKETVAQMEKKLKEVEEFKMLEINLYDGKGVQLTQLDGYVYVTIPVPTDIKVSEGNVLVVYRVNDDGSFTNCNATVVNGEITFRTNHFSTFVIVEQAKTAVVPETGDNNMAGVYFFILLAGCAVAMAGVANRRKYVK